MKAHALWCEQYRPTTLDSYVFHDEQQQKAFERFVADKTIPHLLLSGSAGSGKTTISRILVSALGVDSTDLMTINASDENSVDDMRGKIRDFITTFAIGNFKVVQLEEADYISLNGQGVLRHMMEEFADQARFILTCNYENKIIPAIKSRCQHFRFKAPKQNSVVEYAANILISQDIKFDLDTLDQYVAIGYPDIRKIVNLLQQHSSDGTLDSLVDASASGDYKFKLLSLLEANDWQGARQLICTTASSEELEDVYRFLYENLSRIPAFSEQSKWENGIILIADHLYKHGLSADPEINMAALFIQLGML